MAQFLDEFGFSVDVPFEVSANELKQRESRVKKWVYMLDHWEEFRRHHPRKLQKRVRKGIPHSIRKRAWPLLAGCEEKMQLRAKAQGEKTLEVLVLCGLIHSVAEIVVEYCKNPTFHHLHTFPTSDTACIGLDVQRTFANHSSIRGSPALFNVLQGMSPKYGYWAGMSLHGAACLLAWR